MGSKFSRRRISGTAIALSYCRSIIYAFEKSILSFSGFVQHFCFAVARLIASTLTSRQRKRWISLLRVQLSLTLSRLFRQQCRLTRLPLREWHITKNDFD